MDDSITLSEESDKGSNGEKDFFSINKKIKSEIIKIKNEELSPDNIKVKKFETNDEYKAWNKKNTEILKLINSIKSSIKGKNSKEISLRESLKNEDYDYLKSIIVRKQSKIDYEKTFGDIYEQRENYEEEPAKPVKKKIIRLKIVRKKEENINQNPNPNPSPNPNNNVTNTNNITENMANTNNNKNIEEKEINKINDTNIGESAALAQKNSIKENSGKNNENEKNNNISDDKNENDNNIKDILLINDNIIDDFIKNVDNNNDNDNEIVIPEKLKKISKIIMKIIRLRIII